jgi:lipid-binding SYLF domain-containing protein
MKSKFSRLMFVAAMLLFAGAASADDYDDTVAVFKKAGESAAFFNNSYGYAVFPSIGKGGLGVGAAHGSGRVYEQGKYVGDVKMNQISVGLQAGGQAFSQIIFFEDKRSFDEFTHGNFEFDATAQAVAITASATASAGSTGTSAGAAAGQNDANTVGAYRKGMAIFTIAKGGLMYQAAIGGQKFKYTPKK